MMVRLIYLLSFAKKIPAPLIVLVVLVAGFVL
jgi:hypothetical protein